MVGFAEEEIETDVLVVGGGLAGCWAALRARDFVPRVILAEKGRVARSGDAVFCHEILAPCPEADLAAWTAEMVEHTEYISDEGYLEILARENGPRINQLINWGVPFEKDPQGQLLLALGRGHKTSRIILCDFRKVMEIMRQRLQASGVRLIERVMVTDLLTSDGHHPTAGQVTGAVGLDTRTGRFICLKAKAVILATGVASPKLHSSFADNLTGDGQAMAFRAGGELAGLEFNFAAKFVALHNGHMIVSSLMPLQTKGAHIINRLGERFMERYVPDMKEQRSGIGLLAQAAAKEILEGRGPLYFDLRHFTQEELARLRRVLPLRMEPLYKAGIDPSRDLIPCRPVLLYLDGRAIRINEHGETNVPGLLAGGIAVQFPGCAQYLSGATLAFCNVFGYRAGEKAGRMAKEVASSRPDRGQIENLKKQLFAPLGRDRALSARELYQRLGRKLTALQFSIVKTESSITEMLAEIKVIRGEELSRLGARDTHELVKAIEVRNFLELLEPTYLASLQRRESRLSHYRQDFPFRDDTQWLKWIVAKKEGNEMNLRDVPVPVERNRHRPEKLEKVPAPVQFKDFFQARK